LWWGYAHVLFVLSLTLAVATPLVLVLVAWIDSDIPKEQLLSVSISASAACLVISAVGFCLRRYVNHKGSSFS
jgi:hypothetical protein